MKEMNRHISVIIKIINLILIVLINFLVLGWDTKNEFFWRFNLRIFKEFIVNHDFYSYFYICSLVFFGEIMLVLNVFLKFNGINKKLNVLGLSLIIFGLIWLLSMGFGTPELNYYYVLFIFGLILLLFFFSSRNH
jgi:hypothetical protein